MTTLPAALTPFATYRQFITYTTRQKPNGKLDKIPTNWMTGFAHDAQDPSIWTDFETAFVRGNGQVGFVLTHKDPFWVLDIDNCLMPDGQWSPLAKELCDMFTGAAVEVSMSGKGLHIYGTGKPPRHTNRSDAGLEFYTKDRFVALGSGAVGNAAQDCTPQLATLVGRYFSRIPVADTPVDWTNIPVPEWRGPTDDEDLIRRMCNSKSTAHVFGSRISADQLWTAHLPSLAAAYPANDRPYDYSQADAALAQHLAFWTGKDCDRMLRIMKRSALARDKWDREDYLPRTILKAVSRQTQVCVDRPEPAITSTSGTMQIIDEPIYLSPEMQIIYFAQCTYIAEVGKILAPKGEYYNRDKFDVMFGNGCTFVLDHQNSKTTMSAWEAFTKSKAINFPKAKRAQFAPTRDVGSVWNEGGREVANSYWPIDTPCTPGNAQPFLDHMNRLIYDDRDREIVLSYMAAVIQYKGTKFRWCPLIQGTRGNGKTILSHILTQAIGVDHTHWPKAGEFAVGRFNSWLDGRIFIAVEDIYVPGEREDILEALKPLITGERGAIEGKGVDQVTRTICANFLLNSNRKDAIRMTEDNRGICVIYTHQQCVQDLKRDGMDEHYFFNLWRWLRRDGFGIVHNYLKTYPIKDELNPATLCHRAPFTSSTKEAINLSIGTLEQEILAAVAEGRVGFRGGWISTYYLDGLLRDMHLKRSVSRHKRAKLLNDLGYFPHPCLRNGQANNVVTPDGCKPTLYIHNMSPHMEIKEPGAVAAQYSSDQMSGMPQHTGLQLVV